MGEHAADIPDDAGAASAKMTRWVPNRVRASFTQCPGTIHVERLTRRQGGLFAARANRREFYFVKLWTTKSSFERSPDIGARIAVEKAVARARSNFVLTSAPAPLRPVQYVPQAFGSDGVTSSLLPFSFSRRPLYDPAAGLGSAAMRVTKAFSVGQSWLTGS